MESEIKLTLDAVSATQIKKHPALRANAISKPKDQDHVDRYFDTAGLDLWKHGFALRVRSNGAGHVQTLKGGGSALAGLHRRTELEAEVASESPDPDLFARQLAEALPRLARHGDTLHLAQEPVFVNRSKRSSWMLGLPDGTQVEVAFDVGELQRGERSVQLRELELEVKEGDPARLFELAQQVHQLTPVRIENVSKAERGYALAREDKPQAVKAQKVVLERKASLGDALGAILLNCLQQMQANEPAVKAGDVEACTRCASACAACARRWRWSGTCCAARAAGRRHRMAGRGTRRCAQLGCVHRVGAARPAAGGAHQASLARVQAAAREEAERHRARVRSAVASPRYTGLVLGLGGWVASKGWQQAGPAAACRRIRWRARWPGPRRSWCSTPRRACASAPAITICRVRKACTRCASPPRRNAMRANSSSAGTTASAPRAATIC
jgi:triphosphatase